MIRYHVPTRTAGDHKMLDVDVQPDHRSENIAADVVVLEFPALLLAGTPHGETVSLLEEVRILGTTNNRQPFERLHLQLQRNIEVCSGARHQVGLTCYNTGALEPFLLNEDLRLKTKKTAKRHSQEHPRGVSR